MGVPIVFTTELRPKHKAFFLLPEEMILSGKEFMAAFEAAAKKVISKYAK